jgi:serine/threonine-protein kinase
MNEHEKKRFFEREERISRALRHTNIVRWYGSGTWGHMYYIAQEFCPGGSVEALVKRMGGALPPDLATHIILQVLDALDYAHGFSTHSLTHGPASQGIYARITGSGSSRQRRGVVHRDIKPGNILLMDVGEKPEVRLTDFGLSKLYEATSDISRIIDPTKTGDFAGTPEFTPRAQIKYYKDAKPEMDVWAAAASYYYMLTGFPPKDLRHAEKWKLALIEDAIPIRRHKPEIPEGLAAVIDAALVEEPEIGCGTAAELKAEIERAL